MNSAPEPFPIGTTPAGLEVTSLMIDLDDDRALDPMTTGGKAAALARVRSAGLATLPGVVLTTVACRAYDRGVDLAALVDVDRSLTLASADGALVVRSSSVVEDGARSSWAGQFETVLDVRGPEALVAAVRVVMDSRDRAGASDLPTAVLIQPMARPSVSGVAFGVDPVSGRDDRRVVAAVRGQGEPLVSGAVDGSRWVLDHRGRVVDEEISDGVKIGRSRLRQLAQVLERLRDLFDGPQDCEWGEVDDVLVLFQCRPVTTTITGTPHGPVFGPGPVSETFPDPLSALEVDMWVDPLRSGLTEALRISGVVNPRHLAERELVTVVDGLVAVDLEATGDHAGTGPRRLRGGWRGRCRRLASSWRIGRLRVALPLVADGVVAAVDDDLATVPAVSTLSDRQLLALIGHTGQGLRCLHAHEILLGMVTKADGQAFSGAAVALRMLERARAEGTDDYEILARFPEVLGLTPPRIGIPAPLPTTTSTPSRSLGGIGTVDLHDGGTLDPDVDRAMVAREALRLRIRWMQEVGGRAALELGHRLTRRGVLGHPDQVRDLALTDLAELVTNPTAGTGLRPPRFEPAAGAPTPTLPVRFRLGNHGRPIPVGAEARSRSVGRLIRRRGEAHPTGAGRGVGAGGGVGVGPVTHDVREPPVGSVLVVHTLSPELGPILPRLGGLVSETGSVLAHLAILARENHVPTVVAHPDVSGFVDGVAVRVDGRSGAVTLTSGPPRGSTP
jgi:phosphohistidine swiveling domain-containing protein